MNADGGAVEDATFPRTPEGWSTHGKGNRPRPVSIYANGICRINEGVWRTLLNETERVAVFTNATETKLALRPTEDDDSGYSLSEGNARERGRMLGIGPALREIGVFPAMLASAAYPDVEFDRGIEAVVLDCKPVVEAMVGGDDE